VARAEPADGKDGRIINDASPRRAEPASGPSREPESQPILAAHRDVDPQRQAGNSAASDAGNCESLLANPVARSAQTFRQPVQGLMVAKFGSNKDGSFNDGVDFSVPKGTPVKAAENGVVAYVGNELSGFGNLVLVRHADGYVTAYAHNDEVMVSRCDVVKRGQVIAKAGTTGKVTQPQLHFELRKDSKAIDPLSHFSRS
jgi:murein DD-endopeptidase MepM/ murein hydrolase activator NlpD